MCLGYITICALAHWSSWTPTGLTNGSLRPVMGFFFFNLILHHLFHKRVQNASTAFIRLHLDQSGCMHMRKRPLFFFFSLSIDPRPQSSGLGWTQRFTALKEPQNRAAGWEFMLYPSTTESTPDAWKTRMEDRPTENPVPGPQTTWWTHSRSQDFACHCYANRFRVGQVKHFGRVCPWEFGRLHMLVHTNTDLLQMLKSVDLRQTRRPKNVTMQVLTSANQ